MKGLAPRWEVYRYARELHDSKRVSEKTHQDALVAVGGEPHGVV